MKKNAMSEIKLYHGSAKKIEIPQFGYGKKDNDYGLGFYCTDNKELAKEWACQHNTEGFANEYNLNLENLSVLDLNSPDYSILHWLTILVQNRNFSSTDIGEEAKKFLFNNYQVDYLKYDIIKGYRANDSYFTYAANFLNNEISLEKLNAAMKLGKLGQQVVLKTVRAFNAVKFNDAEYADKKVYYTKFISRDTKARENYKKLRSSLAVDEIFMIDIIRNPKILINNRNMEIIK